MVFKKLPGLMRRIFALITLEFQRNWKQPREWLTVLLFMLATSVVLYMGFRRMRPETWAVMYWVVMLFLSVSATVGDRMSGYSGDKHFYNLLAHPVQLYLSNLAFNTLVLFSLSMLLFMVFGVFFEWKVMMSGYLLLILGLGALSLSSVFCFVAALVSAANKGSVMASLLGFPLVIPVLLLLIRVFISEMDLITLDQDSWQDVLSLIGIDVVLIGLGIILFPLIWRS